MVTQCSLLLVIIINFFSYAQYSVSVIHSSESIVIVSICGGGGGVFTRGGDFS